MYAFRIVLSNVVLRPARSLSSGSFVCPTLGQPGKEPSTSVFIGLQVIFMLKFKSHCLETVTYSNCCSV